MPQIRYGVAMSLDGFIAGPEGEYDWITMDPELDFAAIWAQFDVFLMGRRTFEVARTRLAEPLAGKRVVVASRTLKAEDHPGVTLVADLDREALGRLRSLASRDIWLFGGGALCRTLLDLGELDAVDLSIVPVLLGSGTQLAPHLRHRAPLRLLTHRVYPTSGLVTLSYAVERPALPQTPPQT